jgi:glycerol-3-phosphate acyltransferase PlsX
LGAAPTIALDAMGGDQAPDMVIDGAALALERFPDVRFLLYGDQARLKPLVDRQPKLARAAEIRHTDDVVGPGDKPSVALRQGRQSSMSLAIKAVREGEAAGVVSAGNTGALMAIAKLALRTVPGISRPAIASYLPTLRSETVMLDLGANVDCDARNLVEFAIMGEVFARAVLGVQNPTIGLLNIGSEDVKGNESVREAAAMLKDTRLPIRFHGFVEGDDIAAGTVDVVVTDGFSGNIALKTAEGTVKLFAGYLREAFRHSLPARLGYLFARGALGRVRERLDPRQHNGAILIGLNGIVIKSHGGTDAFGFANAVGVGIDMVNHRIIERIREDLDLIGFGKPETEPAAAT